MPASTAPRYQRIARDLRPGDHVHIDGRDREVEYVTPSMRSEVRVDLRGATFPTYVILWAGDPA